MCEARDYRLDWAPLAGDEQKRERLFLARDLAVLRGDRSDLSRIIRENLFRD